MYQYIPSRFNEIIALVGIIVFAVYGYFFSDNVGGTRLLAALFALSIFRLVPALNKVLASLMSLKTYQRVLEEEIHLEYDEKMNLSNLSFNETISLDNVGFKFEIGDRYKSSKIKRTIDFDGFCAYLSENKHNKVLKQLLTKI